MKSIERRFNNVVGRNLYWSSFICFSDAIKDQRFSTQTIHRWFYKLVNKNDYVLREKKAILAHLVILSNSVENNQNLEQIAPSRRLFCKKDI